MSKGDDNYIRDIAEPETSRERERERRGRHLVFTCAISLCQIREGARSCACAVMAHTAMQGARACCRRQHLSPCVDDSDDDDDDDDVSRFR